MKFFFSLFLSILILSCGGQKKIIETNPNSIDSAPFNTSRKEANTSETMSPNLSDKIILKDVQSGLEFLASDELEGRNTGTKGIEKAAVYIENFFRENNVKPYFEIYRDSFNLKNIVGYNIVGYVEGSDPDLKNEFVILGAHYDHIGTAKEVEGDSIANGANDDASGTVAVMEWAKHFAKTKRNKRSLLFTLYAAEEMGLKGSEHLAKRLKDKGIDLYTMINFEMIGVPRAETELMAYITGFEKSNIAKKINDYAGSEIIGFFPKAKEFQLFKRSDNYPFYKQFKIPAHAISTFDFTNFKYYHHVDDEADKLDFDHMTNFINKMIPVISGMVNSTSKEIQLKNE